MLVRVKFVSILNNKTTTTYCDYKDLAISKVISNIIDDIPDTQNNEIIIPVVHPKMTRLIIGDKKNNISKNISVNEIYKHIDFLEISFVNFINSLLKDTNLSRKYYFDKIVQVPKIIYKRKSKNLILPASSGSVHFCHNNHNISHYNGIFINSNQNYSIKVKFLNDENYYRMWGTKKCEIYYGMWDTKKCKIYYGDSIIFHEFNIHKKHIDNINFISQFICRNLFLKNTDLIQKEFKFRYIMQCHGCKFPNPMSFYSDNKTIKLIPSNTDVVYKTILLPNEMKNKKLKIYGYSESRNLILIKQSDRFYVLQINNSHENKNDQEIIENSTIIYITDKNEEDQIILSDSGNYLITTCISGHFKIIKFINIFTWAVKDRVLGKYDTFFVSEVFK